MQPWSDVEGTTETRSAEMDRAVFTPSPHPSNLKGTGNTFVDTNKLDGLAYYSGGSPCLGAIHPLTISKSLSVYKSGEAEMSSSGTSISPVPFK